MERTERATVLFVGGRRGLAGPRRRLRASGHAIASTATPDAALRRVQRGGVELLVIMGEGASGLELLRRLRESGSEVPALLLTRLSDGAVALQCFPGGETEFVSGDETLGDRLLKAVDRVSHTRAAGPQDPARLLDLAPLLCRDADERVILWTRGTAKLYGWTAEEALGKDCHALLKTVFPAPIDDIRRELEACGHWDGKLVHTRKDGSTLVVASYWVLQRDAEGRPAAVLEVNQNVTELQRLQEALRDADRRKDEFLATLAHELRNPLAPLRNALHTMRLAGDNKALVAESRVLMERQLRHLVRLIDDLLDLSRISRGKVQLRHERVPLADVLDVAVETSRPHLDAAGHRLSYEPPAEPVYVHGDPTRLAQVVANLLNNAAKYTPAGGQVWLTAAREGEEAAVCVRDTGIGITAEALPRIFDMFTQADRALDRAQGGLGIGLSLVKGLVELHGGSVAAASPGPGHGSEFTVRLPLGGSAGAEARAPHPMAGPPPGARRARRRVLVVEDNVDGAASLAAVLQAMGHETRAVHDGPSALEEARGFRPEVVLLDIGLPGMDGYEVARLLRLEPELARVLLVAMTGWGQEQDRRRSREAGFNAHLVKPVELNELEPLLGMAQSG